MENSINILFAQADKKIKVRLQIEILTPISMVSELPGNYYRSNRVPNKYQLCGLFENLLGLHLGALTRKEIFKDIQKDWKKRLKIELPNEYSNSGYQPLVHPLFDLDDFHVSPSLSSFDDLWKKAMRRIDDKTHPSGTPNLDYRLLPEKRRLAVEKGGVGAQIENDDLTTLFKANLDKFPHYYTTLATREYLIPVNLKQDELSRSFLLQITCTNPFAEAISSTIELSSSAYLGHSESWVELKLS